MHDQSGQEPHIDLFTVLPDKSRKRDFVTLITSGMSDYLQVTGENDGDRTELLWYVDSPENWMFEYMLWLARYPFRNNTFLGMFHTMETKSQVSGSDPLLNNVIFLPALFENERFNAGLEIEGKTVRFLWIYPITQKELEFKLKKGREVFMEPFFKREPAIVYDPKRKSMV